MIEYILRFIGAIVFYVWGVSLLGVNLFHCGGKQLIGTVMIYWGGVLIGAYVLEAKHD